MIGSSRPVPVIAAPEPQSILTPSPKRTRAAPANFSKGLAMDSGFRRNDGLLPKALVLVIQMNDSNVPLAEAQTFNLSVCYWGFCVGNLIPPLERDLSNNQG